MCLFKLLLCIALSQVLEMSYRVGREDHLLEEEDLEDLAEAEDSFPGKLLFAVGVLLINQTKSIY